jgi:hypothetical protein
LSTESSHGGMGNSLGRGRWLLPAALVVLMGAALSCDTDPEARRTGLPPEGAQPAAMEASPSNVVEACRGARSIESICPSRLPVATRPFRVSTFRGGGGQQVFSAESGGPYPGLVRRNAPPGLVHLVLQAGDLSDAFPFPYPTPGSERTPTAVGRHRTEALLLETPRWGGRDGTLVLAPSFPGGGIDGDHLIFRWRHDDVEYAVSLHAWGPLEEASATIRSIVGSIPAEG